MFRCSRALTGASILSAGLFCRKKDSELTAKQDNGPLSNYKPVDCNKFKLMNSTVLMRHGARTPNYFIDSKYAQPDWESGMGYVNILEELCYETDIFEMSTSTNITEDLICDNYADNLEKAKKNMNTGQLTMVGQKQAIEFGKGLKKIYMNSLIDQKFHEDQIYLRSTMFPRTYFSMKGVLYGIYGDQFDECNKPKVFTLPIEIDPIYPNPELCTAIRDFMPNGKEEIAKDKEVMKMKCILKTMLGVDKLRYADSVTSFTTTTSSSNGRKNKSANKMGCIKNAPIGAAGATTTTKDEINSSTDDVTIYSVRDEMDSRKTHNFEYPREFKDHNQDIDRLGSKEILYEYLGGSTDWNDKIILLTSPIYNFIKSSMEKVIEESKEKDSAKCNGDLKKKLDSKQVTMKMQLVTLHDSSLIPLLLTLESYNCQWPGFTSSVIFELYNEIETDTLYVRVLYNGAPLNVKALREDCTNEGKYTEIGLIDYEEFMTFLARYSIPDEKYTDACETIAKLYNAGAEIKKEKFA